MNKKKRLRLNSMDYPHMTLYEKCQYLFIILIKMCWLSKDGRKKG